MTRQPRRILGLLVALVMVIAACGDDDDDTETAPDDGDTGEELTPVTVAIFPTSDFAPFYYGIEQGYFEEEGLEVELEVAGVAGAALIQAVVTGEFDISVSNYVSLMLARSEGLDVQVLTHSVSGAEEPEGGSQGLLVPADSEIENIEDLVGKSFGVSALNNIGEITVRATLDNNDVEYDPETDLDFIEVRPGDLNGVLGDDIDVAWQIETGLTEGEDEGMRIIADPMYETEPGLPLAGMYSSQSWLEENPELAESFYRAWQRSYEAASDEDTMREAIVDNTETPPELAERLRLGNWVPELDMDKLALLGQLSVDYEILAEEPNLDELVWTPPEE